MKLKVLLPYNVFLAEQSVVRIVAMTDDGSVGILPQRLDCIASLCAGILVYEIAGQPEAYIAVDQGLLVKAGNEVTVSVRNAVRGTDLQQLNSTVRQTFLNLNEQEREVRSVLEKLETGLIHRLAEFHHDG
ncbi:MAG TPA: F0F1 ATP synthase subunit epsilon [Methylophaga aminisulfidivorans]|uniref:F0F1 ATP synthase subunit epsilon n=2 Tax=root TaxID=1 RepID=A0A7C1ZPE3_9GAMM|nr:F0F1 ATP synthase subunit epsilon [Methylophaga aminisulfidivorans]